MQIEQMEYLKNEFERTNNIRLNNESALDKTVLAISSGSLILSINFLDKIVNSTYVKNIELLKSSWLFLIYSLISTLLGYLFAIHGAQKTSKKINEAINKNIFFTMNNDDAWQKVINICNIISTITLIVGLYLMSRFALVNIELMKSV